MTTCARQDADAEVSETVSEKRLLGRPRKEPWTMTLVPDMAPEVRTRRGQQNVAYRFRAMGILGEQAEYQWLLNDEKPQRSLLSELGRIEDEEALRFMAGCLCRSRPAAHDGVVLVRRFRLDEDLMLGEGSALDEQLAQVLRQRIAVFRRRHPTVSDGFVWHAVMSVLDALRSGETGE